MICPICQSSKTQYAFKSSNFHGHHQINSNKIVFDKCLNCSCIFPIIKIDKNFYKKYYFNNYQHPPNLLELIYFKLNIFSKLKHLPKSGDLLDVGCGQGTFIKNLPAKIKPTGIDLGDIKGQNIINADFLKYKFTKKYDIITFWHSLEHFSDPHLAIEKAISLLKKQGKIYISIPNTNSLAFRLSTNSWFHLDPPRHIFLPNENNVKLLFPKKSKLKINYLPFEFPLDLYWSLKQKPYLKIIYPFLKFFDRETMFISFEL